MIIAELAIFPTSEGAAVSRYVREAWSSETQEESQSIRMERLWMG
jgi:hypothetical protein